LKNSLDRMLRRTFGLLEKVPDVFAMYGWEGTVVFQSHPGVMAISKLLDQKSIVQYRATFDQDIVDEMKEFDDELPRKAQIALDNKLPINWRALDFIEDELPRLLEEKKQLDAARKQVMSAKPGDYSQPKIDASVCTPGPNNPGVQYPSPWGINADPFEYTQQLKETTKSK
jgi:hypothetical protein